MYVLLIPPMNNACIRTRFPYKYPPTTSAAKYRFLLECLFMTTPWFAFHVTGPLWGKFTGSWFIIKMSSYQYRKSHCGDKTVVRSSYLHNGISYTGKMVTLYWISPLVTNGQKASNAKTVFFFVININKLLDKQSSCQSFETPWKWRIKPWKQRHMITNVVVIYIVELCNTLMCALDSVLGVRFIPR